MLKPESRPDLAQLTRLLENLYVRARRAKRHRCRQATDAPADNCDPQHGHRLLSAAMTTVTSSVAAALRRSITADAHRWLLLAGTTLGLGRPSPAHHDLLRDACAFADGFTVCTDRFTLCDNNFRSGKRTDIVGAALDVPVDDDPHGLPSAGLQ